jgi:NAD(P)-dependent dehydrogenase (short-subunit alcohol dehydrogenase family)
MNKVSIVTGSASGLGRNMAEADMNAISRTFGVHTPVNEPRSCNHD